MGTDCRHLLDLRRKLWLPPALVSRRYWRFLLLSLCELGGKDAGTTAAVLERVGSMDICAGGSMAGLCIWCPVICVDFRLKVVLPELRSAVIEYNVEVQCCAASGRKAR